MNIAKPLLKWFVEFGRHDLPWQTGDAYHVWLSEIMLQQTQVSTVIPYFQKFTERFSTITALADAPLDDVLTLWAGLGYYARARNLHKTAQIIRDQYHGQFPEQLAQLIALPGIGRSTAGAIAAQAFNQATPILDGNVKRVLSRLHEVEGWYGQKETEKTLWQYAEKYTPQQNPAAYTQAIMDLGATICTRSKPKCWQCPLKSGCAAHQHQTTAQFPHKKPKKDNPTRHAQWLILSTQTGQIMLEQCQQKLWGGLWIFPHCEFDQDALTHLEHHYTTQITAQQKLPALSHSFTHFHLQIQPILFLIEKQNVFKSRQLERKWIELSQIESLAVPAPVKKVLTSLA